ncbi:acetate/propionate family kinase [Mesorhizobium sp. B2-3-3]|nr:acetate/propionate family kinase [Mesorhizobium sp. B2-3-3]
MADAILTLNAGSSSLKFALFADDGDRLVPAFRGEIEEINTNPRLTVTDEAAAVAADQTWPDAAGDFRSLLEKVIDWIEGHAANHRVVVIGHRIVHGGPDHLGPELVTPDLLVALDDLTPLAPLHEPQNIAPIRAIALVRPALPQVVCFDTAFHHTMPAVAKRFALPREFEAAGLRRYGFHGLSYEYIAGRLPEIAPQLAKARVVIAHLGNGASLCALHAGASVDTTMGFSTLDGLIMGTRPGSLDPGIVLHLLQQRGMGVSDVEDLLYRRSGLLGVSGGISSDMRKLLASTDAAAADAIELFCYRIARESGALVSSLGGLDGLIFTAGIGEHAPRVRELVCRRLQWLGIELDLDANARNDGKISTPASRVEVRVIATDEEAMIARHALKAIRPDFHA